MATIDGFAALSKVAVERFAKTVMDIAARPPKLSRLTKEAIARVPASPGLYCLYEKGQFIYVGESGCLQKRLKDLFDTRNHTCRRSLGKQLFSDRPDYVPATSKAQFPPAIELLLTAHIRTLGFVAIPIDFGRTEIEERIVAAFPSLLNKRRRRGT